MEAIELNVLKKLPFNDIAMNKFRKFSKEHVGQYTPQQHSCQ